MENQIRIQSDKAVNLCSKISKISIYLVVFLLPLFFLPWTANVLDFNKQALLGILVFIGLLAWLLKILVSGEFEFNLTLLNIPVVILLLASGLATIFSLWPYGSFWGWPLNVSAGFISLTGFVLFYFLVANVLIPSMGPEQAKSKGVFWFLFVFLFSGFLAALFGGIQIFGQFFLAWDFSKFTSFNTIGTVNSLGVFLAILLPLTIAFLFIARRLIRLLLALFALGMLIDLILINFWVAWAVLITGSAILVVFGIINLQKRDKTGLIWLPMTLLIIALFFLTLRVTFPGLPQTPIEVLPSQRAEFNIAKSSLVKSPILGTGPGTFVFNFSKFKSKDLNQTIFWNIRFGSGASEILDKLITTGILGILSLFFVFGMFFWLGLRYLGNEAIFKSDLDLLVGLGISSSFTALFLSQFLYPANFSLNLVFWVLLGSLAAIERQKVKKWTMPATSPLMKVISFIFVLVFIFGLGLTFLAGQKYLAEVKYLEGLKNWQKGQSEEAINSLLAAINLNPSLDNYWRDISQLYLVRLNEVLRKTDLSAEEMTNQSQTLIAQAINSTKRATDISAVNVANWNVRGFVYRNMIGILGGAEDWAVNSYQKALELEPTNPYIFTEIGRIYLQKADLLKQQKGKEKEMAENLAQAKEQLEQALELKSDYAPAHFQIAMIDVREGKTKEAIEKLEATKQIAPSDTGLAFQLAVIYYNDNQFDKARAEFERAVSFDQNYSNARYFLGLIYDREKNKNKAIEQFEKIAVLNPDNEEVKKILNNLRAGKPALEGITPAQPPIEEKPPEIGK